MATIKKSPAKKVAVKKMKDGGPTSKKPLRLPYPKDKNMSPQDSAAYRSGAGARDGGQGDGYAGISQNPYFEKGAAAIKKAIGKKKAKSGGSFPDLNKDGKITKADILKGRGVIAKKGASVKKKKMQYGGSAASMTPPMMKSGGKCKNGC